MKQHIVRIALGLLVALVLVGHAAKLYQVGFIAQLDNIIYDYRLRLTMPATVDDRIVILDIDERSIDPRALGHWPWGRDKITALLQKLFDKYGVLLVGIDVIFAEPDTSSGLPVLERLARTKLKAVPSFQAALNELRSQLDYDAIFAKFIRGRPVVLGYYFSSEEKATESGALPEPVLPAGTFAGRAIAFTTWKGYGGVLPEFQASAANTGHTNPLVDPDGVSRRVPMLEEFKGGYYEALSLAVVRLYVGMQEAARSNSKIVTLPKVIPGFPPERFITKGYSGLEWLEVGPLRIPVDENVSALVPYRGAKGSFPYISLADVWLDNVPAEKLKGKIALIGTTAQGLFDLRSTPVAEVYPGVEIHANLIAGMLDGKLKQKPPYMLGAEVVLLVIGGVVLSLLIPMLAPLWATVAAVIGMALITLINLGVWSYAGSVLPLAASILMTATLYTVNMAYGYFVEARSKRQFTELFGQYVPPELVDKMAEDPEKYNMEPRNAELTILFSDVRGFTGISEALSPEHLREYINEYLTEMSTIIRSKYKGTLDKYMGDAIMAFWGAPVEDPDHARNGVLAALEMQRECAALNQKFASRGWPPLKIGIGVNSGGVRVGDMGSQVRRAYTVMGDPVNVASRLEARTKHYGVGILVGEATKAAVGDVVFREVDRIKVKGKDDAVTVYEPVGLEVEVDRKARDELKLWNQTLKSYRAQHWDGVEVNLLNLQRMNSGCSLYELYAREVTNKRRNPPPADWNGVTVFDEK
ncbi:MAG TPA: adenylate/guanylate cyclase domain-containing protein [Burkholderiales bacterium]|nr:adenylate/guanylate cyclase domain-containing protein [Burkholderiales bacterium]